MFADKKIVFINDTSNDSHWGCFGTSDYLKNEILKWKPKNLYCIPVWDIHGAKSVPENVRQFESAFHAFKAENKHIIDQISRSDLVIVNGEGTIHGFRNATRTLLYIIYLAKRYYDNTVFLINHSCFPKSTAAKVVNYYKLCYRCCDFIAVREKASHDLLSKWGIKAELSFDSLPLKISEINQIIPEYKNNSKYICLSGGVNFKYSKIKYMAKYLNIFFRGYDIIFLSGSPIPQKDIDGDKMIFEKFKKYIPSLEFVFADSFLQWLSVIKASYFLLTGRFHYAVAKMAFSGGVIAMESNTPKISEAMKMFGLPCAIPYKMFLFNLAWRFFKIRLFGVRNKDGLLSLMCAYAEKNYKWPVVDDEAP